MGRESIRVSKGLPYMRYGAQASFGRRLCHHGNTVLHTSAAGGTLSIGGLTTGVETRVQGKDAWLFDFGGVFGSDKGGRRVDLWIADMGTPGWEDGRWATLAMLAQTLLNAGEHVVCACMGGHGRSGMGAAILCVLLGLVEGDPVEWIRRVHCGQAVETVGQERYVRRVLGVKQAEDVAELQVGEDAWMEEEIVLGECDLCGAGNVAIEVIEEWGCWVCGECLSRLGVNEEDVNATGDGMGECEYCTSYEELRVVDEVGGKRLCISCRHWWTGE